MFTIATEQNIRTTHEFYTNTEETKQKRSQQHVHTSIFIHNSDKFSNVLLPTYACGIRFGTAVLCRLRLHTHVFFFNGHCIIMYNALKTSRKPILDIPGIFYKNST